MNDPEKINIQLRVMRETDFPDCQRLREQTGWNQTLADWQRFLSYDSQGCFVALRDNQVVGTACTISYEDRFGWVAMVIVDKNCQRMGIGTRLLNAGIEHLESRGLTVKLDATPAGKMLYDTLGFHDEYGAARMECHSISPSHLAGEVSPIQSEDLTLLSEYDAPIFGAFRKPVLDSYMKFYPQFGFCIRRESRIVGYIMAREGTNAFHIGPWVADSPETARLLVLSVIDQRRPERIFIDIVEPNPHVRSLLESMGFQQQRPFIRMFKGENKYPGQPEFVYGMSGPELG